MQGGAPEHPTPGGLEREDLDHHRERLRDEHASHHDENDLRAADQSGEAERTAERTAYLAEVTRCVKPGGYVMVATFGLDGPEKCSGLPVTRYDADGIHQVFGDAFDKIGEASEQHETPFGTEQSFVYCFCRRT